MALGGTWTRLTSFITGAAIGGAAEAAVEPVLEPTRQEAWSQRPYRVLRPETAAAIRARETVGGQTGIDPGAVNLEDDAKRNGVGTARFNLLTELARSFPGAGELLRLRWRYLETGGNAGLSDAQLGEALRHEGWPADYIDGFRALVNGRLSPEDVANAVQQGFIPNDGLLTGDTGGGQPFTPPVDVVNVDATSEAQASGIGAERLKVLAELSGNPPGPETLLELWRRGIITETAVDNGIREGRTKTKWTAPLKALKAQLLTPAVLVNRRLRGWDSADTFHARMALHGFDAAQAEDWYESAGRPAAPGQMMSAWARGVDGPDGVPMDEAQFRKGIVESDIRPEWAGMLWGIRYNYPSLFQLRGAVQDGALSPARALEILRNERYEADDAKALVASWTRGSATGPKGLTATDAIAEYEGLYITRAELVAELQGMGFDAATADAKATAADARRTRLVRNAAIGAMQKRYEEWRATPDEARARLAELNVTAEAATHLLTLWDYQRADKVKLLTPAQLKKALGANLLTRAEVLTELEQQGYSAADAATLLDE